MTIFINYHLTILPPHRGLNNAILKNADFFFPSSHYSHKSKFRSNHRKKEGLHSLQNHLNPTKSLDFTSAEWSNLEPSKTFDTCYLECAYIQMTKINEQVASEF